MRSLPYLGDDGELKPVEDADALGAVCFAVCFAVDPTLRSRFKDSRSKGSRFNDSKFQIPVPVLRVLPQSSPFPLEFCLKRTSEIEDPYTPPVRV